MAVFVARKVTIDTKLLLNIEKLKLILKWNNNRLKECIFT